jgi:hypothetical protein
MKALNLILLALAGAMLLSMTTGVVLSLILPQEIASPLHLVLSFLIGWNARQVTEKILGYTLKEALEEKKSE